MCPEFPRASSMLLLPTTSMGAAAACSSVGHVYRNYFSCTKISLNALQLCKAGGLSQLLQLLQCTGPNAPPSSARCWMLSSACDQVTDNVSPAVSRGLRHADVLPAYGANSLRAAVVPADQVPAQPALEQAPAQPMQTEGGAALQAAVGQLPAGPAAELPVFTQGEQALGALIPMLVVEVHICFTNLTTTIAG